MPSISEWIHLSSADGRSHPASALSHVRWWHTMKLHIWSAFKCIVAATANIFTASFRQVWVFRVFFLYNTKERFHLPLSELLINVFYCICRSWGQFRNGSHFQDVWPISKRGWEMPDQVMDSVEAGILQFQPLKRLILPPTQLLQHSSNFDVFIYLFFLICNSHLKPHLQKYVRMIGHQSTWSFSRADVNCERSLRRRFWQPWIWMHSSSSLHFRFIALWLTWGFPHMLPLCVSLSLSLIEPGAGKINAPHSYCVRVFPPQWCEGDSFQARCYTIADLLDVQWNSLNTIHPCLHPYSAFCTYVEDSGNGQSVNVDKWPQNEIRGLILAGVQLWGRGGHLQVNDIRSLKG